MSSGTMAEIEAFNSIFTTYRGRFVRFAHSYVRDMALAEDFTSEAMLYYWENRKNIDAGSNVPAYILKTIKHKCLNHLQHQQVRQEVVSHLLDHQQWELQTRISGLQACEPEYIFRKEILEIVDKTMEKLPEQTRNVFKMKRIEQKSNKEIAECLGITVKGVEFHMTKALKLLRKNLKDYITVMLCLFYLKFF